MTAKLTHNGKDFALYLDQSVTYEEAYSICWNNYKVMPPSSAEMSNVYDSIKNQFPEHRSLWVFKYQGCRVWTECGLVEDIDCSQRFPFICEIRSGKQKQI